MFHVNNFSLLVQGIQLVYYFGSPFKHVLRASLKLSLPASVLRNVQSCFRSTPNAILFTMSFDGNFARPISNKTDTKYHSSPSCPVMRSPTFTQRCRWLRSRKASTKMQIRVTKLGCATLAAQPRRPAQAFLPASSC
jgi:hypothetical protein